MSDTYLSAAGEVITMGTLRLPRAKALAEALSADIAYARLVECRHVAESGVETIVLEVEPEIPQRPVHDIRGIERITVSFEASDQVTPEVRALRTDFPSVPHLNLRTVEFPRSLCLYDEPWRELQLRWTPAELVARLRDWLAKTARDELHAAGQPLEPILFESPWTIVVPQDLLQGKVTDAVPALLQITKVEGGVDQITLIAEKLDPLRDGDRPTVSEFIATTVSVNPQQHGTIRKQPGNLLELAELLAPAGIDLLGELRLRLRAWQLDGAYQDVYKARLVLMIVLPKIRAPGSEVEATETWAFLFAQTIAEIGEQIGIWGLSDGVPGLLIGTDETKLGDQVGLALLNPTETFTRQRAASLGGVSPRDGRRVTAIGLGALGSQVFLNLIRTGYGEWVLIDHDLLLPHNLARHALSGSFVGRPKVAAMAILANDVIAGDPVARSLVADVLDPRDAAEDVSRALREAEVILDASASVAVARHLARDVDAAARRVSLFLNPAGTDAVLLVEDSARVITLDLLEMQYYRHLTHDPALVGHLQPDQSAVRYGAGCRDRSGTILQDLVALHAANGSRALRTALARTDACIMIFKTEPESQGVESIQVCPVEAEAVHQGDWTLYADHRLLEEIARMRTEKLPNETGGVLIGAFDTLRRIVYVVDQIASPPDSEEQPTLYIRGVQGLRDRVEEIAHITAGNLVYGGEWHSHPAGSGCSPSDDDRKVFQWLSELRQTDGLPPVMLIAGDQEQSVWHINHIAK